MVKKFQTDGYIIALDVGEKRIGVAITHSLARLPRPYGDIQNVSRDKTRSELIDIINRELVIGVVVGVPRNLNGDETAQSRDIRNFAESLSLPVPLIFVDESLSSVRADQLRSEPSFAQASRDSLAACFILEEYIHTVGVA